MTRRVCTLWWRTRLSVHATTRYREIWVQHAEPKKLLYVSKTTNAEATHKQHSCQSTHHLQQQQPTTAATTTTVQLRFMLCPLLRRWFMYVCLSLHSVVQTLIHSAQSWQTTKCAFFYNCASLCVCAARELRVCRSLCMCVACVYRCVFVVSTVVIIISIGMCELELVPTATS